MARKAVLAELESIATTNPDAGLRIKAAELYLSFAPDTPEGTPAS